MDEDDLPGFIIDIVTEEVLWSWNQDMIYICPWAREAFVIKQEGGKTNVLLSSNQQLVASYEEGELA
jgi:hypothetical protein